MSNAEVLAALTVAVPSDALIVNRDVAQSLSHRMGTGRRTSCVDPGDLK
ncbi:MAG TPA: hypothetical protein VF241_11280 [Propionibacteriaceae bacterium]